MIKIKPDMIQNILPLTNMQQEMLFVHLMNTEGYEYIEQQCYRLLGAVNPEFAKQALYDIVNDNDMLRAVFLWEGLSLPVQVIKKSAENFYEYVYFSNEEEYQKELEKLMDKEFTEKVDIRVNPFKVKLCSIGNNQHYMIWTYHHIILDGWSNANLLKEFYRNYGIYSRGEPRSPVKKIRYSQYISWWQSQSKAKALAFWHEKMDGFCEQPNLKNLSNIQEVKNNIYIAHVKEDTYKALKSFIYKNNATLASLFYWMWANTLMVLTNSKDVVFGVTISGRSPEVPEIDTLVGLFIRTLPLRIQYGDSNFIQQLQTIKMDISLIEQNQNVYLSDILPRNQANNFKLLDSIVVIQNYLLDHSIIANTQNLFEISLYNSRYETNLDLTIGVKTFFDYLEIEFSYKNNIYSQKQIQSICSIWNELLARLKEGESKENLDVARKNFIISLQNDIKQEGDEV